MQAKKLQAAALSTQPVFIEDVFSTYLYTGNGSTQTITNGIDLAGEGGLVWIKNRNNTQDHSVWDTSRGTTSELRTNSSLQAQTVTNGVTAFGSSGFTLNGAYSATNDPALTYVSWTFRKAPKFFDVVTYTGNGTTQNIAHSLGSTPGCIIVKNTTSNTVWSVWHRSVNGGAAYGVLNLTDAFYTDAGGTAVVWGNNSSYVAPTATQFTVGSNGRVNTSGNTYVAYLFAHDAGGFGEDGSENVISCGSYVGTGANGTVVNLGYEPQWLLVKNADAASNWCLVDNMRGVVTSGVDEYLRPNTSDAGDSTYDLYDFHATGFEPRNGYGLNNAANTYIYIAIRRGPMKTPTTGTEVYNAIAYTGNDATRTLTGSNFPIDLMLIKGRSGFYAANSTSWVDRLRGTRSLSSGATKRLSSANTGAEDDITDAVQSLLMDGYITANNVVTNGPSTEYVNHFFRRAPGFFDVVCYTGTGSNTTVTHGLGVVPELIFFKRRGAAGGWPVFSSTLGVTGAHVLYLNSSGGPSSGSGYFNSTLPTASVFSLGTDADLNASSTYVAYLFASVPGISKVFSYTGNGSSQTINCGFTGGARFVLIKRTDNTGDWYVWDSTRGIVAGNDPHLSLNTTAAEVTTDDSVDTDSTGFIVNQDAATNVNVNSATYIFLAIA